MDNDKEWLEVPALDQWMKGWDKYLKNVIERPLEKLTEFVFLNPAAQVVVERNVLTGGKGKKALDFACGDGRSACYLAKLGFETFAIDALESAIEATKRRAKAFGVEKNIQVIQSTMDNWELKPESYDVIIATQCLQYLFDNAVPKLKEIAAAIKPGGWVAYSGNILPHFKTEPEMRFIVEEEIKEVFDDWTFFSLGKDLRYMRPNDTRGYIWAAVQKPEEKKE